MQPVAHCVCSNHITVPVMRGKGAAVACNDVQQTLPVLPVRRLIMQIVGMAGTLRTCSGSPQPLKQPRRYCYVQADFKFGTTTVAALTCWFYRCFFFRKMPRALFFLVAVRPKPLIIKEA